MRLLPRSLHWRMLAISAVAAVVALGIAGWTTASVLERFVTAGIDRRLDSEVALLATAVDADGRVDRGRLAQRVGALEAERGWRWTIRTPDAVLGSADLPPAGTGPAGTGPGDTGPGDTGPGDTGPAGAPPPGPPALPGAPASPPPPIDGGDLLHAVEGSTDGGVAVHARAVALRTPHGAVVITAAAPRDVIRRPIRDAVLPLLAVLASLAGVLAAATLVQVRVGLRPVRALRDQLAAIRAGVRERVDEDQPSELQPLAVELNALARDNEAALATARLSAANLAHALKTPVSALALELRDDPARAAQVARIDRTIQHHLARARAETIDVRAATALRPAIADLTGTIGALYRDRALAIEQTVAGDPVVAVDARDLDELIGNLLDNAAKHAASRITVRAAADADARFVRIEIDDDGPGIPAAERARVAEPGVRLDEQAAGHGFGLGIAVNLVSLYGGTLALGEAMGGGLSVRVRLPSGTARTRADG